MVNKKVKIIKKNVCKIIEKICVKRKVMCVFMWQNLQQQEKVDLRKQGRFLY